MTIATYAGLSTAIADRISRSDLTATVSDECIALAEVRLQRLLRTLDMETNNASIAIATEYVTVPADFLAMRAFYLNVATRYALEYMPDDTMTNIYSTSGQPRYYNVSGGSFRFGPAPDASYTATLIYYAKIPAITSSNTTNWLLTAHPDAYLYGALMEVATRLKDPNSAAGYQSLYASAIQDIQANAARNRWGGPGMAVRLG